MAIFSRTALTQAPGVHELGWRERRRVLSIDEFDATADKQDDLLAARSEILFHKLYDSVARNLAVDFNALAEPDDEERSALNNIAELVGWTLTDEDLPATDPEVDEIVWRNAARAATLTLFDHLANGLDDLISGGEIEASVNLAAVEWAERVLDDTLFDRSMFVRTSGLVGDEVERSLQLAAEAITGWEHFGAPGTQLSYHGDTLFIVADAGANKLHCVRADTPTIAYLVAGTVSEDKDCYFFRAHDSVVMPVTTSLYFRAFGSKITVTSGDSEQIAPDELGVSFKLQDAKPMITQQGVGRSTVLRFDALAHDATVAVPKTDVRKLPGDAFLLKSNLEHRLR